METAVRKATRLEYRPPKEKHLQSKYNVVLSRHPQQTAHLVFVLKKKHSRI